MTSAVAAPVPSIFDQKGLAEIKRAAKGNDPQALKAAARQFEALFLQMVLKSMREATPPDSLFGGEQARFYETLLDQQLSQTLTAKNGVGLAALIEKQLSRAQQDAQSFEAGLPLQPAPGQPMRIDPGRDLKLPSQVPSVGMPFSPARAPAASPTAPVAPSAPPGVRDFVSRLLPEAMEASRTTGIPAQFMVAQAALETGWGRSLPRLADGSSSNNLFGIKASRDWKGPVAEAVTTEFVDGVPLRQVQRFRAYRTYADAFADYSNLLTSNPRYAVALNTDNSTTFARGLQRAGYATDPAYAAKLERIISTIS